MLTFADGPVKVIEPERRGFEWVDSAPASEFCLSRVALGSSRRFRPDRRGPELLCTEGTMTISADGSSHALETGVSLFVPASAGAYEVESEAIAFRATVGVL